MQANTAEKLQRIVFVSILHAHLNGLVRGVLQEASKCIHDISANIKLAVAVERPRILAVEVNSMPAAL